MSSHLSVPLSRLYASKRNPRRVKPGAIAHHTLVALIKTHGLLQPLVVRPSDDKSKDYVVIAGHRRLAALKEVHRNNGDPKIHCVLKRVDDATADAIALAENFSQEPMHPLDEAEAFAKLAAQDGKDAESIAAEFGVTERYVRQRMKLSTLAKPIKESYRNDAIDTATAEAFAAVPQDKQLSVWNDVKSEPRNAQHVRSIIANDFIDLKVALFDASVLPPSAISQDLFSEQVLVERSAFLEAQANALNERRQRLLEEGWSEVVCAPRGEVQDRLISMEWLDKEFDAATDKKLGQLAARQEKLEKAARKIKGEKKLKRLQDRFDQLATQIQDFEEAAPAVFSENTKSRSTVFLLLDPDGRVHQEYRRPKHKRAEGNGRKDQSDRDNGVSATVDKPLTSDDLSDSQRARICAHEVIALRAALYNNDAARWPLLAMILHEKVRSNSIALKHEPNTTTLHAVNGEGFKSESLEKLRSIRAKCDPLEGRSDPASAEAFTLFSQMNKTDLMRLIALLTVELLFNNPNSASPFVMSLARQLKVSIRSDWTPDAHWLSSYQKIQLAHLASELLGPVHAPAADAKKSELVEKLAKLFADAASGHLPDKKLAEKVNQWLPSPFQPPHADAAAK